MEELKLNVHDLVIEERERAAENHRTYFVSSWEATAKLEEELLECDRELREVQNRHSMFKYKSFDHKANSAENELQALKKHAELLACEAIQLAAVAKKTVSSIELWNDYGEIPMSEETWLKDVQQDE